MKRLKTWNRIKMPLFTFISEFGKAAGYIMYLIKIFQRIPFTI